jgi:ribosome-binding protein aMBF1 (putative translation factor)
VSKQRREPDFLEEMIAERTARNPRFPEMMKAAERRRQLLHSLAKARERAGVSQTALAARMDTSQSAVARLEAGEIDAKLSTLQRFAIALGRRLEWRLSAAPRLPRPRRRRRGHQSAA